MVEPEKDCMIKDRNDVNAMTDKTEYLLLLKKKYNKNNQNIVIKIIPPSPQ